MDKRVYESNKMLIVRTQQCDKLVFVEYMLSLRASAHTGVAIPRLEGKCIDNCPTERENLAIFGENRYLVPLNGGIATTSVRTGLAMTALFFKHQFVALRKCRYRNAQESQPQMAPEETLLRA